MKRLIALGILLTTLGCTSQHKENTMDDHTQHHGHHQGTHPDHNESVHAGHNAGAHAAHHGPQAASELIVATEPAEPVANQPVTLKLMIHSADGAMVKHFEVVHEEKVHLVVVREELDHFAHIHPAVDARGNLTIRHTFPTAGNYQLFADYKPVDGGHATATGSVSIGGESQQAPALIPNAPGDIAADGIQASISAEPLKAGEAARVKFALQRERGGPAALEDYMGAAGHLMFVSAAGRYVHVHPMADDAAKGTVEFAAHFPNPGLFKGWGQFKHDGQVRVVPFVVDVK
jgi:hypothetical protein